MYAELKAHWVRRPPLSLGEVWLVPATAPPEGKSPSRRQMTEGSALLLLLEVNSSGHRLKGLASKEDTEMAANT